LSDERRAQQGQGSQPAGGQEMGGQKDRFHMIHNSALARCPLRPRSNLAIARAKRLVQVPVLNVGFLQDR
jgi:hypothetical protein